MDIDIKAFKQVMPVLPYLDDDDIIICCDDDILYPSDYIEARLNDMKEFDNAPLTGCLTQKGRTLYETWGIPSSTGYVCCFQKKHISNIEKFVDQKVLHTFNADGTYAMVEWLNGYVAHDVTKYDRDWMHEHCSWNEVCPGRENGVYMFGNDMLEIFRKRVCELTGMDIFDEKSALCSRGFFAQ